MKNGCQFIPNVGIKGRRGLNSVARTTGICFEKLKTQGRRTMLRYIQSEPLDFMSNPDRYSLTTVQECRNVFQSPKEHS